MLCRMQFCMLSNPDPRPDYAWIFGILYEATRWPFGGACRAQTGKSSITRGGRSHNPRNRGRGNVSAWLIAASYAGKWSDTKLWKWRPRNVVYRRFNCIASRQEHS